MNSFLTSCRYYDHLFLSCCLPLCFIDFFLYWHVLTPFPFFSMHLLYVLSLPESFIFHMLLCCCIVFFCFNMKDPFNNSCKAHLVAPTAFIYPGRSLFLLHSTQLLACNVSKKSAEILTGNSLSITRHFSLTVFKTLCLWLFTVWLCLRHTTLNAPDLVWSRKLSRVGPG